MADLFTDDERAMLAALRRLSSDDGRLDAPPAELWSAIEHEVLHPPSSPGARHRRLGRRPTTAALAAAVVVAVAAVGWAATRSGSGADVVARAAMSSEGLGGAPPGLHGEAEVVDGPGGEVLRLDIDELDPATGEYLEVWLITPDVSGMVSLGTARTDGTYDLPGGLRIADYPIVDVSTEPFDGDPAHSGASLVRGTLSSS